ncbi:MAG: hypothetical protein HND39_00875 [Ignavibacteriota bacterium]|nr:hypothetical protein [Ignavibacteriales bacterium]MCZ7612242.1 hypothetical protein [Ignavibacteriaceae bacterium]QKJ94931.1 MAG: hypothetical protein HND39_00875 [Ignavibacteriota bacterium]
MGWRRVKVFFFLSHSWSVATLPVGQAGQETERRFWNRSIYLNDRSKMKNSNKDF